MEPETSRPPVRAANKAQTDGSQRHNPPTWVATGARHPKSGHFWCFVCGRVHEAKHMKYEVQRTDGELRVGSEVVPPVLPSLEYLQTCDSYPKNVRMCNSGRTGVIAIRKIIEAEKAIAEASQGPSSPHSAAFARRSPAMFHIHSALQRGTYSYLNMDHANKKRKTIVAAVTSAVAEARSAARAAVTAAVVTAINASNEAVAAHLATPSPPPAPGSEGAAPPLPSNVHVAEGNEKELLEARLRDLHFPGDYNYFVVDSELGYKENSRPSRKYFEENYNELLLPAAVFQTVENEAQPRLRFLVRDTVCSDDAAITLANGWTFLLNSEPKLSPITADKGPRAHYDETRNDRSFKPPSKFRSTKEELKNPDLKPKMFSLAFSQKQGNPECFKAGLGFAASTHKAANAEQPEIRTNQMAVLTLLGQAIKSSVLDYYFSGGLDLLGRVNGAVTLDKLPFTGAAVAINGWAPCTHVDPKDFTGWAFINFLKTGELDGVFGGEFLFPSYGLYFKLKTQCTVLFLNTAEVPHCATQSFAADGGIIGSSWYVKSTNVTAAQKLLEKGETTVEERVKCGFCITSDDMEAATRTAPEIVALRALVSGAGAAERVVL